MMHPKLVHAYNQENNGDYSIRLSLSDHFEIDGELVSNNTTGFYLTRFEAQQIIEKLEKVLALEGAN